MSFKMSTIDGKYENEKLVHRVEDMAIRADLSSSL
jgi:hypothetical protein